MTIIGYVFAQTAFLLAVQTSSSPVLMPIVRRAVMPSRLMLEHSTGGTQTSDFGSIQKARKQSQKRRRRR